MNKVTNILLNILWFIFAGFWQGITWIAIGCLWCITVLGIPIGLQCFKMAGLAFLPFGKTVDYGGGAPSLLLNILWVIFGGFVLAFEAFFNGLILCATIIGIPFGLQCFKQAKLALMPFGAEVNKPWA
ncbi:MAG: YccF domain-containing protein [Eggerthellaceae bacterium]|jgi:uncharacterized membrane protein YccF (DUF307 family)|nr:YccF domain-containing protein [Eggerthellaceae bacterium]MDR2721479.1 YccF domain-containing protein [Coriobacteriaceae bacterium]